MRDTHALVVGTAGHIDHGKTSLVYALTGIDTDRLKEEKQRGISIDLGFAQMQTPEGPRISFVDVPGHERFVRNMLAGAAGIEAVLLIVAANESVKPQTREHFEICRLLGLRHGLIVLTKIDLATAAQLNQTRMDVHNLVRGSFLQHSPIIEVSALTQAGLPELKRQLLIVAANNTSRDRDGIMRMPIDRAFVLKGFGSVVTGTLAAGSVQVGQTLELHPQRTKVRVRGLQAQHAAVEQASAGQRLAINLAGIDHHDLKRGQVLTGADLLSPSRTLDVELNWLSGEAPPSSRELFIFHIGAAETNVKINVNRQFARLRLAAETIALPGDRFVIRRPSPAQTVGGGTVIDAFPPRRLNRQKTFARLERLNAAALPQRIEMLLGESVHGRKLPDLIRLTGSSRIQLQSAIAQNSSQILLADDRAFTRRSLDERRQALLAWLRDFHKMNPNAAGAPLSAARLGLDAASAALVFKDFPAIRIQGETVALTTHKAAFTQQETAALEKIETAFRAAGFQPPSAAEVITNAAIDSNKARALLDSLIKSDRLIKLPDDLIFHADVIAHIRNSLAQHKGRKFSVAEFKSWTNISRKFAIPLLEYLDQQRLTRREGDLRIVL